jgi:hypothetical protein
MKRIPILPVAASLLAAPVHAQGDGSEVSGAEVPGRTANSGNVLVAGIHTIPHEISDQLLP